MCLYRTLSQSEQWRCLVSELIAVCYRMSDVVSPVVQSSSPEGLIPMDTDSGNLILQQAYTQLLHVRTILSLTLLYLGRCLFDFSVMLHHHVYTVAQNKQTEH